VSAFIYAAHRLPACIAQTNLVLLGQSREVFAQRGFCDVESWQVSFQKSGGTLCALPQYIQSALFSPLSNQVSKWKDPISDDLAVVNILNGKTLKWVLSSMSSTSVRSSRNVPVLDIAAMPTLIAAAT
jgi:Family of unknown function (DUF6909)